MRRRGLFGLFMLAAIAVADAQTNYVAIRGLVTDPQNLGIPAASVKLTDERTGRERETTADGMGLTRWLGCCRGPICSKQ